MTMPISSAAAVSKSVLCWWGAEGRLGEKGGTSQRAGPRGDREGDGEGGVCKGRPMWDSTNLSVSVCVDLLCVCMCIHVNLCCIFVCAYEPTVCVHVNM